jgi:hypothetical protein
MASSDRFVKNFPRHPGKDAPITAVLIILYPENGSINEKPAFNHKPEEVLFLINADLKILLDPSIVRIKPFKIRGEMLEIKYFNYEENTIWGATAMMLNELLIIIRRGGFFPPE